MMVSISKSALLLYLLLTTLFSLQLKGSHDEVEPSEVEKGLIPHKVHVAITNFLISKSLTVHCREKHHDLGTHILNYGETYNFSFRPNIFWKVTLYFCRFIWIGADYSFDIYKQDRDECVQCIWNIFDRGACKIHPKHNECYVWQR